MLMFKWIFQIYLHYVTGASPSITAPKKLFMSRDPCGPSGADMAGISYSVSLPDPCTSSVLTTNQSRDGQTRERKGGTFAKWWLSQQRKPQKIRGTFISVATREIRQPGRKCFCRLSSSPRSPLPFSILGPSLELSLRGKECTQSSIT